MFCMCSVHNLITTVLCGEKYKLLISLSRGTILLRTLVNKWCFTVKDTVFTAVLC
jgi:hypothetical protein